MNSLWLIVFVCTLLCKAYEANIYEYELPDGDEVKSLRVIVNRAMYKPVIHVYCNNYDSLKYLEIRQGPLSPFEPFVLIELTFVGCFNNETNNENYNYRLWDTISRIPNFLQHNYWYQIDLTLDKYADVNGDKLLENFNFTKFQNTNFRNFGFETSRCLARYTCKYCSYSNIKHFDLNDVRYLMKTHHLKISYSELINFNSENMKKFKSMTVFQLRNFSLADRNAFNVPRLFEHNGKLTSMFIDGSKHKIILHEDVFRGLFEIRHLELTNLQLDYVPENLFIDITHLHELLLNSNNIKTLQPNTFSRFDTLTIELKDNPIFTMPHEKIEGLVINAVNLYMGNFTNSTFNVVEALVNSPIGQITFRTLLVDPIDIREFTKVHQNRTRYGHMDIYFDNTKVELDMEYIKLHSIPKNRNSNSYRKINAEELNVVVTLPIKDTMCADCWIMKQFLENYFSNRKFLPEFYFPESRVLIKPGVSCAGQTYRFENVFETNCPTDCACKYNGLLDKIIIDCNNRNLTEIPVIPYPEQYDNITSFDLYFENNLLTNLTFDNQNIRILEKLSTLKFRNNKIVSINLPDVLNDVIHVLDLCGNDGLLGISNGFRIATGYFRYTKRECRLGTRYPRHPILHIRENKSGTEIEQYLDTFCHKLI